ncbi:putative transmembrane protein [bacterium BMS3Abin12]|nr:putative transmembrane protein [bacterium BMS3Abin12]GBE50138.1 putative transmembrane protein [bacterium BMS3Bbin13]HDJ86899.1 hypothetical protein [Chromatiales bacterium]
MKKLLACIGFACAVFAAGGVYAADGLTVELSHAHVEITSHFTGKKILVYGVRSHPGAVIVKLVSPPEEVNLSRKIRIGPFWVNGAKVAVHGAPAIAYLLSSEPLDQALSPQQRARYGLTLADVLKGARAHAPPGALPNWRAALLTLKRRTGHYRLDGHAVNLASRHLFRAVFDLPADVPIGSYHIEVYLAHGGRVVARDDLRLAVLQPSFERRLARAAHDRSWAFGTGVTLLALAFGLSLSIGLRWFTRA